MASSFGKTKRFKTAGDKTHSVDLSLDPVNYRAFGWMVSYNQRAILVRAVYNHEKCRVIENLQFVKFLTRDRTAHEGPGYKCHTGTILSLDNFYAFINIHVKKFDRLDIVSKEWEQIVRCVELLNFEYDDVEGCGWQTSEDEELKEMLSAGEVSSGQQVYLTTFESAMKCDMRNGHAKTWLSSLVETLMNCTDDSTLREEMRSSEPSYYCNINTTIEMISGDIDSPTTKLLFDAVYTPDTPKAPASSEESMSLFEEVTSANTVKRRTVVPDFCILLKDFPGRIPLVIEAKGANMDSDAVNQVLEQMLSRLFFQDVVFGIAITPTVYHLAVIIKKEDGLHFSRTNVPLITLKDSVNKLDVGVLNSLCTFIYQVLKWSKETKCLLPSMIN